LAPAIFNHFNPGNSVILNLKISGVTAKLLITEPNILTSIHCYFIIHVLKLLSIGIYTHFEINWKGRGPLKMAKMTFPGKISAENAFFALSSPKIRCGSPLIYPG
jgi:hypothetical protein